MPIPPLTGLTVLVTRPADQGLALCRRVESLGGEAVALPAVVIEPLADPVLVTTDPRPGPYSYDVVIFVSQNAVTHGLKAAALTPETRIAAIGKSTAAALTAAGVERIIVPERGFTSEALLEHPDLQAGTAGRVLIVRGGAGRDVLEETLTARDIEVDYLEAYRRAAPQSPVAAVAAVETRWLNGGIDVVTLTSGEILHNLDTMLTGTGRGLLQHSPLLVTSARIADAAVACGCRGEILVSPAPDNDSLVGILATWRTRARLP